MAVDEQSRHQLFARLQEVLGLQEATTLMAHLPPLGWGDVATKRDLAELRLDIDRLEHRLTANFRAELLSQTRTMIFALVGTVISLGGLTVAALRFA